MVDVGEAGNGGCAHRRLGGQDDLAGRGCRAGGEFQRGGNRVIGDRQRETVLYGCLRVEAHAEQPDAIPIAQSGGTLHPVVGLWPVTLAQDLEQQLRQGVRKVLAWTARYGTQPVPFPCVQICGISIDPFFNANTPQELDELRAMLTKAATRLP